ncbi:hypothetical protein [Kutzneria albida]|uniref:Peptidase M41 domain-containing protein n=1 Tax=Kutzneria albida DSM 43870 TaxID=1449976 RepID=W5WCL9_9PSEU|nr:hypothetical protein [Kutzneria albida]AHH98291.1 hypothetical protein KALB_4929 [Kutzneria albida DSM 43870]
MKDTLWKRGYESTTGLDQHRLRIAAHELGHMVAWQELGLRVVSTQVWGHGEASEGFTKLDGGKLRTRDDYYTYLVGLVAGRETDLRWSELHRMPIRPQNWARDMNEFSRLRNERVIRDVTDAHFAAEARRLVLAAWSHIKSLAPGLARKGSV